MSKTDHWFKLLAGKIAKATKESAAFDLFYNGTEPLLIGDTPKVIPTGVKTIFSPGLVAVIKEKSGLAVKGVELKAGVIDADYRDEWGVVARFPIPERTLFDYMSDPRDAAMFPGHHFRVNPGDKVAQFLLIELPIVDMCCEDGTGEITISGETRKGGFGSTGT